MVQVSSSLKQRLCRARDVSRTSCVRGRVSPWPRSWAAALHKASGTQLQTLTREAGRVGALSGWPSRPSLSRTPRAGSLVSSGLLLFLSFGPSVYLVPPRVRPASAGPVGGSPCPCPGPLVRQASLLSQCPAFKPVLLGKEAPSPTNRARRARRSRSLLPGLQ